MAQRDPGSGVGLRPPLEVQAGEGEEPARHPARSWDESVGNGPPVLEAGLYGNDTGGSVEGSGGGMDMAEGVEV